MNEPVVRRMFVSLLLGVFCIALVGCTPSVSGTYHHDMGIGSLDFKSGGKVTSSGMGDAGTTYDYKADGEKITILKMINGEDLVLTVNSDGSLSSEMGTFRKRS